MPNIEIIGELGAGYIESTGAETPGEIFASLEEGISERIARDEVKPIYHSIGTLKPLNGKSERLRKIAQFYRPELRLAILDRPAEDGVGGEEGDVNLLALDPISFRGVNAQGRTTKAFDGRFHWSYAHDRLFHGAKPRCYTEVGSEANIRLIDPRQRLIIARTVGCFASAFNVMDGVRSGDHDIYDLMTANGLPEIAEAVD